MVQFIDRFTAKMSLRWLPLLLGLGQVGANIFGESSDLIRVSSEPKPAAVLLDLSATQFCLLFFDERRKKRREKEIGCD